MTSTSPQTYYCSSTLPSKYIQTYFYQHGDNRRFKYIQCNKNCGKIIIYIWDVDEKSRGFRYGRRYTYNHLDDTTELEKYTTNRLVLFCGKYDDRLSINKKRDILLNIKNKKIFEIVNDNITHIFQITQKSCINCDNIDNICGYINGIRDKYTNYNKMRKCVNPRQMCGFCRWRWEYIIMKYNDILNTNYF